MLMKTSLRSYLCFLLIFYSFTPLLYSACTFLTADSAIFRIGDISVYDIIVSEKGGQIVGANSNKYPDGIGFKDLTTPNTYAIASLSGIPKEGTEGTYILNFVYYNPDDFFDPNFCLSQQKLTLEIISPKTPSSPQNASGTRVSKSIVRAKKGHQFSNIITWDQPEDGGPTIVAYRIYRDKNLQHLLGEIPRHARKHYRVIHPNRNPCKSDNYYIVSVSALDNESLPAFVNIKARKRDCCRY